MRTRVIYGGLALVVGALVLLVIQKEQLLQHGTPLLLELAPVDPRSLMQGDYMVLNYAISQEVRPGWDNPAEDGRLVLRRDEAGVGRFVGVETPGLALGPGELWLNFKVRGSRVRLGAESFFFQEGHADHYARAKYGELRVAADGTSVLVGLRDAERQPLGPPASLD
ncbi:GDYXXLXY domain-containing protein [Archangium primigenium]|uniref:GDYXXLXY domain-containing protein n=1 Tax=[Archangium] primigenium TaxID=2792470 RepID=UPI0030841B98